LEFHYHVTYLVAARAGFSPEDARTIAYASQYTDDNRKRYQIDQGRPTAYVNYLSQTENILKPARSLMRIYPLFHFLPGDPLASFAWRKDGSMHWLNTTPGSENAEMVLATALAGGDWYRIGIAAHAYTDSWAHQNFAGYWCDFNSLTGPLSPAIPNIGHAEAGFSPDRVGLTWEDPRLIREPIDNQERFLAAAVRLYARLSLSLNAKLRADERKARQGALQNDLARCLAEKGAQERLTKYNELALSSEYGGREIRPYHADEWMNEAVRERVRGLRDRSGTLIARLDPFVDVYEWQDRKNYRETHWFRFQEAVKEHQRATWRLLAEKNFLGLELPGW
jgi:hypothetical protein